MNKVKRSRSEPSSERAASVYDELGVRSLINATGTVTKVGGSLMAPEVLRAMQEAASEYVDLSELLSCAGARIAQLFDVPAAHVTSGAGAAGCVAAAACMTGSSKSRIYQLPDTSGLKDEILIHRCHRNVYDQPIRMSGAKLVEFCFANKVESWQLSEAVTDRTAALFYFVNLSHSGTLPFDEVVSVCRSEGVPIVVNAASELPPPGLIKDYLSRGADLVICSGGKDIAGPQGSGLILGREELVAACALNSNPHYSIGRPFKVSKEEIVGLVKAVEIYTGLDHDERFAWWASQADFIYRSIKDVAGFRIEYRRHGDVGGRPPQVPRIYISPESTADTSIADVATALRGNDPSIAVGLERDRLIVNPQCLRGGEEKIVAAELKSCLEGFARRVTDTA